MANQHQYAAEFLEHLCTTQRAYEERRLDDYLAGFGVDYYSVQLNTDFSEDREQLGFKIAQDFERFNLLEMEFEVLNHWFTGDTGYAHLGYHTRLKYRDSGKVLTDTRENLIIGRCSPEGRWLVECKIVLSATNSFESESSPDI